MFRYLSIVLVLVTLLMLATGCENRGDGVVGSAYEKWQQTPNADHSYDSLLAWQLGNLNELWLGSAYLPKVMFRRPIGEDKPVPMLILLPPQDGNKDYFFQAGLLELAQELIDNGEIQPFAILCPSNAQAFGGMMYGQSEPAGLYDDLIGARMIDWFRGWVDGSIIDLPEKRGIGGFGMGSYGAFRALLKHPDKFGSISVSDGPLDFDGSGNTGLKDFFLAAIREQDLLTRYHELVISSIDTNVVGIDTTFDTSFAPADTFTFQKFDSGDGFVTLPLSRLFIGGSIAFSPHDTGVVWDWHPEEPLGDPARNQLISTEVITDSSTLITNLTDSLSDYHLPFDSDGVEAPAIWALWMNNNLDNLYTPGSLDGIKVWIANNAAAKWNYGEMTASWIDFLRTQVPDSMLTVHPYSGFDGPVVNDEYTYDLLREMLKFHSKAFGGP
jgi:hypothetical protein